MYTSATVKSLELTPFRSALPLWGQKHLELEYNTYQVGLVYTAAAKSFGIDPVSDCTPVLGTKTLGISVQNLGVSYTAAAEGWN